MAPVASAGHSPRYLASTGLLAADYFAAINALQRGYQIGVYGGFYAVSRVLSAGLTTMGWQTSAWSGGQWDERAVLRQLGTQVWGTNADVDVARAADFGQ